MITEIHAKTILNSVKQPDDWFGLKYNMNLYRGCQHQCIYCDSRSACYHIENFADIHVKTNAVDLLADALPRKRIRGTIGFGSMNDPYMPIERKYRLCRRALEVIAEHKFPVHIITKSDLVLRDLDLLKRINADSYAAVSFTITTADDELARKIEPGAPPSSARFAAMKTLSDAGIHSGVTMMPILPFIADNLENVDTLLEQSHLHGANYILPWFGLTLRTGSREYFYEKIDKLFLGVKEKYIWQFGERYECNSPKSKVLYARFEELRQQFGIADRMTIFAPEKVEKKTAQMKLL